MLTFFDESHWESPFERAFFGKLSVGLQKQLHRVLELNDTNDNPCDEFELMCVNFENAHHDIGF